MRINPCPSSTVNSKLLPPHLQLEFPQPPNLAVLAKPEGPRGPLCPQYWLVQRRQHCMPPPAPPPLTCGRASNTLSPRLIWRARGPPRCRSMPNAAPTPTHARRINDQTPVLTPSSSIQRDEKRRPHLRPDLQHLAPPRDLEVWVRLRHRVHRRHHGRPVLGRAVAEVNAHAELVVLHARPRDARHAWEQAASAARRRERAG
jgi:hypothetical protein